MRAVPFSREDLERAKARFKHDLQVETRRSWWWIASLVVCFGVNVFIATYNIIEPGDSLALQIVVVTTNIAAAVYGAHVVMNLARIRAEWLNMLEQLR